MFSHLSFVCQLEVLHNLPYSDLLSICSVDRLCRSIVHSSTILYRKLQLDVKIIVEQYMRENKTLFVTVECCCDRTTVLKRERFSTQLEGSLENVRSFFDQISPLVKNVQVQIRSVNGRLSESFSEFDEKLEAKNQTELDKLCEYIEETHKNLPEEQLCVLNVNRISLSNR